jgi:hypothetical protein
MRVKELEGRIGRVRAALARRSVPAMLEIDEIMEGRR